MSSSLHRDALAENTGKSLDLRAAATTEAALTQINLKREIGLTSAAAKAAALAIDPETTMQIQMQLLIQALIYHLTQLD